MRNQLWVIVAALAVVTSIAASAAIAGGGTATVYDAVPSVLAPNVASLGFEATSTSEFGDYVHLGGTNRHLASVTVTMSDWAVYADYSADARYSGNSATWTHPITVNVYSNHLGANGAPDTVLATTTSTVTIPWRPATDLTCGDSAWRAADHLCYHGIAFNGTFDFSDSNVTLPDDVIIGVAYNTADYGSVPIHQPGPYNSLNVGVPTGQTATIGTDDNPDNVFWNTSYGPFYADGGAAGVGIFRQDTAWAPNGTVAFRVTASGAVAGNAGDCKNGGWESLSRGDGTGFKNQGDCIQYVNTGK